MVKKRMFVEWDDEPQPLGLPHFYLGKRVIINIYIFNILHIFLQIFFVAFFLASELDYQQLSLSVNICSRIMLNKKKYSPI